MFGTNLYLVFADTKSSADIVIQYGVSTSWAHTYNTRSGTTLVKSNITLDDWDFYNNGFDTYTVTNLLMHELGHAIGLAQITVADAQFLNIHSVMVEDIFDDTYFSGYPTTFDGTNLLKM